MITYEANVLCDGLGPEGCLHHECYACEYSEDASKTRARELAKARGWTVEHRHGKPVDVCDLCQEDRERAKIES